MNEHTITAEELMAAASRIVQRLIHPPTTGPAWYLQRLVEHRERDIRQMVVYTYMAHEDRILGAEVET